MSKFCADISCNFYKSFPDGTGIFTAEICPICSKNSLVDKKPLPPDEQIAEHFVSMLHSIESEGDVLIVKNLELEFPNSPTHKPTNLRANKIRVTFYTAILLSHFKSARSRISIRFDNSHLMQFIDRFLDLECSELKEHESNVYALLRNSINIPFKILKTCGVKNDENMIIPYRYILNGQEEVLCSNQGATHRALLLHFSNFFPPNLINKYDMLILPPDLTSEEKYLYSDVKLSLETVFNLYSPNLVLSKEGRLLPFKTIKDDLETVLYSLYYSLVCKASKFTKMKHFHIYSTKEVGNIMSKQLLNWINTALQTDFPFHIKFYLSFLTLDNNLIQEYTREVYLMLFHNLSCEFVLSISQEESERNLFLEYQLELIASPQLIHSAMRRVSELETDSLILFLPLYHLLFNSEQDFEKAHINNSFLDNAYWGLPAGIQFEHNPNIETSKIINAISQLNTLNSPILPYSITLLYLRLDLFSQLMELSGIPFLPFFSVLLYRIEKWSLLREDIQLRESVFNTFLTQSEQNPNLMSHEHICQASDVIFQILRLIMDSPDIPNISFKEACLFLQVLARLLSIYDGDNNSFSEQKFHLAQANISYLIPSSALIKSIEQCFDEDKLNKPLQCNIECIDRVILWNTLYCIHFPPSYGWAESVSKEFFNRLKFHSLQCILNSIDKLCCTSETETSLALLNDICTELIQIAEESETPLADHELMVQSLVEVPENRISSIIDVLAKILMMHKLEITGANPVEYILSVSWYPALFKHCCPDLLKNSIFPEAESLLSFCVNTIRKLDSNFQALTISVNHLKLIIEYKSIYILLLKHLPVATNIQSWDETTFDSILKFRESILNYFLHQHKLIGDLKRLLDSTNSGIYSTEISDFLALEYNSKSISFLCSTSEQNEFVLMPGNTRFNSLNKLRVKDMLNTLPDVLQSQFFRSQFKHNLTHHMATTEFHLAIDMDIICGELWVPALLVVSNTLSSLFDLSIQLTAVEKHFGIYTNCPEEINEEITHLLPVVKIVGESYDEAILKHSLDKVICYFRLKTIKNLVIHIIQVKKAYSFTGQFSIIESISNLLSDTADNQLSFITPDLVSTADILSDLTELHLEILENLICCFELFTWTAGVLDKSADLDNFTDLALNSVDSTCFQVNRITSFKDVCTIFMPFIIQVEAIDQHGFLAKLKLVHDNLQKTDKSHIMLAMSRDCAKESELEFWKELKQTHTSIGGKTISQLKRMMENGKFILSTNSNTRNVDDILKFYVCPNTSLGYTDQLYSLEVLKEMQSNIILITPLMHEDKDSAKFVAILEEVIILADLFLQMHISGNIYFRELTHEYTCQSIGSVKQDIAFLRDECKQWKARLVEARDDNYLLNYFTASQIVNIQVGLEGMSNGKDLTRDTFHLLSLVREQLSQQDIENANRRIEHGTSSFPNSESLDFIATSSSGRGSISKDDKFLDVSLTSFLSDHDDVEPTEMLIKDLYKSSKKTIYSLNDVGIFLSHLCSDKIREQTVVHSFLKDNEPNLIFIKGSNLLIFVLSLYLQTYSRTYFPSHHEVLICSEHTSMEEIDIFWRRALNSPSSTEIFCLAFIENLKYDVAVQSVTSLKKYLQLKEKKGRQFLLVLMCSSESKQSSYMATALAQYKRIHTQISDTEKLKNCVFQRISRIKSSTNGAPYFPNMPSSVIDPDKSCVRIISSEIAGSGKSLTVLRLEEKLKEIANVPLSANMCTKINVFESQGCEHITATKLIDSPVSASQYGRIYHLDISATSYEELIPFLFKLIITGVICDKFGNIWRCSKRNYFVIEITLSSQSPELLNFLALFPDWQCLTPNKTLEYLKTHDEPPIHTQNSLFDQKEMKSPEYQRVYAYLNKFELKQKSQNIDTYRYKLSDPQCEKPVELLGFLLKHCSIDKPSWSVLKHFISFLNNQLVACEGNIYCNIMVTVDKSWKGFKTFLVESMILMSRDFTTPSLRNSLEGAPTDIIQGYCIEPRRKWEEKNHPYIFLNEDGHTMSFFGIYITEQLEQLDSFDAKRVVIGKKVFPKELYRTLKLNKADLEQDCSTWDRNKMISILSNVMDNSAIPWTDIDPCYVLTIDNLKKMLAIHMRFRCNIPVIIMGETGCGKTRLINFMCKLQAKRRNIENLVVLKVHGETTRQDILKSYEKALKLARINITHEVDTVLFFDEANTSHTIRLIKEILCDRRIDGNQIPTDFRLQFIAACNPYRKHTPEMISKLASAGLGIITGGKIAKEHFGDIPLRDLVYRVIPLPQSLLPLVWDFGKLSSETENSYIIEIINLHLKGETFTQLHCFCYVTAKVLSAVQEYMRERRDECSFVSLRDVERTVRVMLWFFKLIPKLRIEPTDMSLVTYSLVLSLSVCYRAKLKDRTAFDSCLIANLVSPLSSIKEVSIIGREIGRCRTCLVNLMKIPDHIARNAPLKENLFMMYVCIQLKIPLFIIGKPGSSKSLARSIINHSINEGILVEGNNIAEYTRVYMQCYQCSQFTTSKEISDLYDKCQTIQKEVAAHSVVCVVLDEVGLAEDSSNLPLKVLHSLLEDSATSEFAQRGPNVAFIGLSNWALDPAKMNRGIMVQLEDPSIEELMNTAHAIIQPSGEVDDIISERLNLYARGLVEGYLELFLMQNYLLSKEYFGLRDFYCLMKMLYSLCRQYNTPLNKRIVIHMLKRNFGGITDIDVLSVFNKSLTGLDTSEIGPLSDPLSLIRASLDAPLNPGPARAESVFCRSRYLLLLTENYVALDILFQSKILNKKTKVIFGSNFPQDKQRFNICHSISRIKVHMELGEVVVLTNLSNLYESLYELLNQSYVRLLGKNWVTIGIGSQRVDCPVDPKFRLIVVADKTTVYDQFPPPLINRLEKHILTMSTILSSDRVIEGIVRKLSTSIKRFTTVNASTLIKQNVCFIGFQEYTPSFIVYSTISKFGSYGIKIKKDEILKGCKRELLKLASPDSILRLPRSKLSSQADSISNMYFSLKLSCLSDYLQQLFENQISREDSPILSFITTRSQLLTETDIAELVKNLELNCKDNFDILNLYLNQFKTEKEFVSSILDEVCAIPPHTDGRKIVLIQCTDGYSNSDLISCAKYKVMEIVTEHKTKLNSNFYFLFIVRLLITKQNSIFSGFCGIPWDSVHIDELRPPYHNLLPSLDIIKDLSVAEIFDFHYQLTEESFLYTNENYNYFKRRRLLRCVQAAVSRLIVPHQCSSEWKTKKISLLDHLLTEHKYSDLADVLCKKISQLLRQITLPEYSNTWSLLSSLRADNNTTYPTVMKTLSHYIDTAIEPILAGVLSVIDALNNLELAFSNQNEIRDLWGILFQDDSLFNFEYFISADSLRNSKSYTLEYSMNVSVFSSSFPFFLIVYQRVTRLYDYNELNMITGRYQSWKRFEALFDETSVGQAIKSIKIRSKINPSYLHYKYLENFVRIQVPKSQDQLYKVVYVMLVVAISNCQRELKGEEGTTANTEELPEISIPLIHIASGIIRERIAFVKEAYSLGYTLPNEHLIRSDNAYRNPKTLSQLKQVDFDLFESIIIQCSKEVSCSYKDSETLIPIQYFLKCERLIEENIYIFNNDVIKLDTLRCSWYATKTVVLFATNLFGNTESQGMLRTHNILKNVLDTLQKIVSNENVNFQSPETFKSIVDLLKNMNMRAGKNISDDKNSSDVSKKLWNLFQIYTTRFFQQFLTDIVLRATDRKLPDDLIKEIIDLALIKKEDISNTRGINLFLLSDIHPSAELRCILLELVFRESQRNHSSDLLREELEHQMSDVYQRKINLKQTTHKDEIAIILLQSIENSYHHRLAEYLTFDDKLSFITQLLNKESIYVPLSDYSGVSHKFLESVAVLRFAITWLVKWYSGLDLKERYLQSQITPTPEKRNIRKRQLIKSFNLLDTMIEKYSLYNSVLLFLFKTIYFNTGFSEVLSHSRYEDYKRRFIPETRNNGRFVDLFVAVDPDYCEALELVCNQERGSTRTLKKEIKKKRCEQSTLFAIFSVSCAHFMSVDVSSQELKTKALLLRMSSSDPAGFATMQKQKWTQLLPPDLKKLAEGISQNKFLNMRQFHISKDTHLNTISIAGLICHVAVLLQYALDNEFLKPLTLIHYLPSVLKGKYLPALPQDLPSVLRQPSANRYSQSIQPTRANVPEYSAITSLPGVNRVNKIIIHILGNALERGVPTGIRRISAVSVALLRSIMHCIFTYTLQTKHMECPSLVTQLVEPTGTHTCSEYFFLHLIQDITDLTTITNKTFEEAVLIIHTLIERLIEKRDTTPVYLETEEDLDKWENAFETIYVSQLDILNDQVLKERMRIVLDKSQNCDISLLRVFYEESETDFASKLWRHRNIIGYDHLLQVFSCQLCSANYPLLEKFLNQEPLLSVTKYIPEFVILQVKLVRKSMTYFKNERVKDLNISKFLDFLQKEESSEHQEYTNRFESFKITCTQLVKERDRFNMYYPQICSIYEITNYNTRIGQLVSASQGGGVLTSLIQLLVEIHNSFIDKYRETFPNKQSGTRSTIPLSLVTSHHLINYKADLENLIFSNASHSFLIGEGTLITYDFKGIENDFADRFILNKLSIEDDLKVDHSEGKLCNIIKRLQLNIPQEAITEDNWNSIRAELKDLHDISEVLSLLELVINFASYGKERPQRPIVTYMQDVLKYPNSEGLISKKADETCSLKHLLSLWHNLSIHRAKLYGASHRLTHVDSCYMKGLDSTQISALKSGVNISNIDSVLTILYDYILFSLCDQQDLSTPPDEKLQDCLLNFSESNSFLTLGNSFDYKLIPQDILVAHTMSTWTNLVLYSKELQAYF